MNYALTFIRQAAERVCLVNEKQRNIVDNNKPEIEMNDANELINNFKHLINISDYAEKIKLLTLAPKTWGRLKIANFFSCSQHQA